MASVRHHSSGKEEAAGENDDGAAEHQLHCFEFYESIEQKANNNETRRAPPMRRGQLKLEVCHYCVGGEMDGWHLAFIDVPLDREKILLWMGVYGMGVQLYGGLLGGKMEDTIPF